MTIGNAIEFLNTQVMDAWVDAKNEHMGNANVDLWDAELSFIAGEIISKYQREGKYQITEKIQSSSQDFTMKFWLDIDQGNVREGGESPSGGTWEEWNKMDPKQRLTSLSKEFVEDWVTEFKQQDLKDRVIVARGTESALAWKIINIITGGDTHDGRWYDFFLAKSEDGLASVAEIHDKTKSSPRTEMMVEIVKAWVVFMKEHPRGIVRKMTKSLDFYIGERLKNYA